MKELFLKRIFFILKYLVGLVLLAWILGRVDRQQMIEAILSLSTQTLLFTIVLAAVNISVQFFRWKYLIESHSQHFEYKDLIPSFFAGFAFRMMIPGGHAEITKVFLLPGQKRGKVVAFGIEKFFQTYIKLIFVLIAFPVFYPQYRLWLWSMALIGALAYFFFPSLWGHRFMERFREKELNYPRIFIQTLVYSLLIFSLLILQYYFLLNDAHTISLLNTTIAISIVWGAGLLPISVSGMGVRENLAVFFLAPFGVAAHSAVGIALLIFVLNNVLPASAGLFFIYRKRRDLKEAGGAIKSVTQQIYEKGRAHFKGNKQNPS